MRVYISGKIGEEVLSKDTRRKFAKAEAMLGAKGYDVFNPTNSGLGSMAETIAKLRGKTFYEIILLMDIQVLIECDAIYMMSGWQTSPGAKAEYYFAKATKKKIIYERMSDAEMDLFEALRESWRIGRPLALPKEGEDIRGYEERFIMEELKEIWAPIDG